MLIKKGFAWGIVDEEGKLVDCSMGMVEAPVYLVFPTKNSAKSNCAIDVERVVKVKIKEFK
jgi:hypothetical protein